MESHYESDYGKLLWKFTMSHYGNPLWKSTMEIHYGNPRWKATMESSRKPLESHYGRPLCKTTMTDRFYAVKSVQESYPDLLGSGPSGTHWSPKDRKSLPEPHADPLQLTRIAL